MFDYGVVGREFEFIVRSETGIIVLPFGRCINPAALIPAERALLVVAGDNVLSQLRTNGLEQISKVPDDGIVPKYGVLPLNHVVDDDASNHQSQSTQDNPHLSLFNRRRASGTSVVFEADLGKCQKGWRRIEVL
jgi:hypothetical protein